MRVHFTFRLVIAVVSALCSPACPAQPAGQVVNDEHIRKLIGDIQSGTLDKASTARAHAEVASFFHARRQPEVAIDHYHLAIHFDPTNLENYLGRASARIGARQFAGAVCDYTTALIVPPPKHGQRQAGQRLRIEGICAGRVETISRGREGH
jgi:hypothetical protein